MLTNATPTTSLAATTPCTDRVDRCCHLHTPCTCCVSALAGKCQLHTPRTYCATTALPPVFGHVFQKLSIIEHVFGAAPCPWRTELLPSGSLKKANKSNTIVCMLYACWAMGETPGVTSETWSYILLVAQFRFDHDPRPWGTTPTVPRACYHHTIFI